MEENISLRVLNLKRKVKLKWKKKEKRITERIQRRKNKARKIGRPDSANSNTSSASSYIVVMKEFAAKIKRLKKKKKRKRFTFMSQFWKMLHKMIRQEEKKIISGCFYEEKNIYQRRGKKKAKIGKKLFKYGMQTTEGKSP